MSKMPATSISAELSGDRRRHPRCFGAGPQGAANANRNEDDDLDAGVSGGGLRMREQRSGLPNGMGLRQHAGPERNRVSMHFRGRSHASRGGDSRNLYLPR